MLLVAREPLPELSCAAGQPRLSSWDGTSSGDPKGPVSAALPGPLVCGGLLHACRAMSMDCAWCPPGEICKGNAGSAQPTSLRRPLAGSLPSACTSAGPCRGIRQRSCHGAGLVPCCLGRLSCALAAGVSSTRALLCSPSQPLPATPHVWCVHNVHISNEAMRASQQLR